MFDHVGLRKFAEAERRRKEEAEHKAKLDEIAEKQRQRERELEEKEKKRKEEILGKTTAAAPKPAEPAAVARPLEPVPTAAAATAAPTPGKYVPPSRLKRQQGEGAGQAPPPETDRWVGGSRPDDRASPGNDRWRPSFGGGGSTSRSSWSSSRPHRGER